MGYVLIMTSKKRIGIVVALIWSIVRILYRDRRAATRGHHRSRITSVAGDPVENLAGTETSKQPTYKVDPSNFGDRDAQVVNDLFDILEGVYGEEAEIYFQRYVKLWPIYRRLKNEGVNVRISLGRFRQEPLLIINGQVYPIKL